MSIHPAAMPEKPLDTKLGADFRADAERWYARLKAADCTATERMEFQRWRAVPEHADAYAATERLWQSLGKLAGRPELERLSQQVLADTAVEAPRLRRRLGIAAAVFSAVLCGVFFAVGNRGAAVVVYATQPGERSTVKLADGSQLILNASTELAVQLDTDTRRLTLRKGEALFKVAHDTARPFKVKAGDSEVTALGTRFQVRDEAEQVTVTLLEGSVAVDRLEVQEHAQLEPGDQVRFVPAQSHMTRGRVDPELVDSWTTGRLRFRSTPLAEALDEINRYSSTRLRIADPTLASTPISGTFEVGDSASVVSALEALLPIRAQQSNQEILLQRP